MKQVNYGKFRDWQQARKHLISATDSPVLLGMNPFETREQLKEKKLGRAARKDLSKVPYVQVGIDLEFWVDYVGARKFDLPTADPGDRTIQVHPTYDFISCTCDRFVLHPERSQWWHANPGYASRGPLEMKTGHLRKWGVSPPAQYVCQLQHQMMVTGHDEGWLMALLWEDHDDELRKGYIKARDSGAPLDFVRMLTAADAHLFHYERDEQMQIDILNACLEFKEELEAEGWGQ